MTRRIRVAFIHHFFPHYRLPVMRYLNADRSLDCTFIGDDHEPDGKIKPATIPIGMKFVLAPSRRLVGPVLWQGEAIRAALSTRFDVLVLHGVAYWASMWAAAALGRASGKRVFLWGHGYLYPPTGLKGGLRRMFYALPHAHLLYGHFAKDIARQHGWPDERLHVIHNGLDPVELNRSTSGLNQSSGARIRQELFGNAEVLVIASITRLITLRRLDLLVVAATALRSRGLPVCLLLIGDGPEYGSLAQQCAAASVPVHFEGACYDEKRIARLLSASHIAAAPGCVGLTAIHCMGYGLPVVTHEERRHQMPEFEAIIPDRTGSLVKRGDALALADALESWLSNPERLAAAAVVCRSVVERIWNARTEAAAIGRALRGLAADDLWQLREQ
jgi:glycosyltransferase involved in cell wall biosynthesis